MSTENQGCRKSEMLPNKVKICSEPGTSLCYLCFLLLKFFILISPARAADSAETAGGWRKYEGNPVLGGSLGTCFDVALLREGTKYRMWFSWRPKKSVALVESADGIHWSEPEIVLGPNPESSWEDEINRPVLVKRADGYHLWYTGQSRGSSRIGYAKSTDGRSWARASKQPVLS